MATVTQADVEFVTVTKQDFDALGSAAYKISGIMEQVFGRIRLDEDLNASTDFADITAIYLPKYDEALEDLKALAEALPRWDLV